MNTSKQRRQAERAKGPPPDPGPWVYIDYSTSSEGDFLEGQDIDIFLEVKGLTRTRAGSFFHDRVKVTPEVLAAETAYLVTARYSESDSGGTVSGKHKFLAVVASQEEAQALVEKVRATAHHHTLEHPWMVVWGTYLSSVGVTQHTLKD